MAFDLIDVPVEGGFATLLGARFQTLQKCTERNFGIDHHFSPRREFDDHIWAQSPEMAGDALLLKKITIGGHAGQFSCLTEGDFSPASSYLRRPQGIDQF